MKSFNTLGASPAGLPVAADDLLEFHAARLLLLFKFCGKTNRNSGLPRIDGLTKMAKLDFFVRHPARSCKDVESISGQSSWLDSPCRVEGS
jgi:hypothetical protein